MLTPAEAADLFRSPPRGFIPVGDGAEVAHRVIGSGPAVLFVHGWPVSGATFRTLLPHLVDHVTCHVIDLPGAGASRYLASTPLSLGLHVRSVRAVIDALGVDDVAVVGHDSGGMIARHAVAGHPRLRSMGLIDTEHTGTLSWRFRSFVAGRHVPGFGAAMGFAASRPRVRRNPLVFGAAFADRSHLDGEFAEFFFDPLHRSKEYLDATMRLFRSFDPQMVRDLEGLHQRITVPVQLVWGELDRFFPVRKAEQMVSTFPNARMHVVEGAGTFSHEERPAEVAQALLQVLTTGH